MCGNKRLQSVHVLIEVYTEAQVEMLSEWEALTAGYVSSGVGFMEVSKVWRTGFACHHLTRTAEEINEPMLFYAIVECHSEAKTIKNKVLSKVNKWYKRVKLTCGLVHALSLPLHVRWEVTETHILQSMKQNLLYLFDTVIWVK